MNIAMEQGEERHTPVGGEFFWGLLHRQKFHTFPPLLCTPLPQSLMGGRRGRTEIGPPELSWVCSSPSSPRTVNGERYLHLPHKALSCDIAKTDDLIRASPRHFHDPWSGTKTRFLAMGFSQNPVAPPTPFGDWDGGVKTYQTLQVAGNSPRKLSLESLDFWPPNWGFSTESL